jgi:predicted ATPase
MAITNIKVSNFKSFKDLDLNLGRFNVVIGANASGKSNFVEIFRFLKTLEKEDLANAISLHDGGESILNKKLSSSEPLQMRVTSDRQMPWGGGFANLHVHETTYGFCLQIPSPPNGVVIKDDHLTQKLRTTIDDEEVEMTLDILMSEGGRKLTISPPDVVERVKREGALATYSAIYTPLEHLGAISAMVAAGTLESLLIHRSFFGFIGRLEDSPCGQVGIYDIRPHVVKERQPKAGRISLEEDGKNLDLVLKGILADPEKRRKFHNLLRYMLPFAVEAGVQDQGTSLLLKLREEYYEDSLLANLLSDGTVDVVALIVALFFEDKDVVIIEEPERNLHPRLMSGLIRLMEDAARNKQIIITTHSPEIVKHAGVENLLLISRDKEGFSTISRPAEKEAVRIFLQNDLGLDDLFVQDVLAVP